MKSPRRSALALLALLPAAFALAGLFVSPVVEKLTRFKPWVMSFGILQRLPYLVTGLLLVVIGLIRPLGRVASSIPLTLANAMLAGVLLPLCLAPLRGLGEAPALIIPLICAWAVLLILVVFSLVSWVVIIRKGEEQTKQVTLGRLADDAKPEPASAKSQPEADKPVTQKVLGLDLAALSKDLRGRYKIKDAVKGVLVTGVDDGSDAAEKRLSAGDVIVEVAQEGVGSAADIKKRVDQLKKDGKKSVLLLVANGKGAASAPNPRGPYPGSPAPRNLEEYIGGLFKGTLSIIDLPAEKDREARFGAWAKTAKTCSPSGTRSPAGNRQSARTASASTCSTTSRTTSTRDAWRFGARFMSAFSISARSAISTSRVSTPG